MTLRAAPFGRAAFPLGAAIFSVALSASGDTRPRARDAERDTDQGRKASDEGSARPEEQSDVIVRASSETSAYTDSDNVNIATPSIAGSIEDPIAGWSVGGSYLVDVVSAASIDIVATASRQWREIRQAGGLHGNAKVGEVGLGASASISTEPDYLAYAAGATISMDFDQKNLTALLGYSYGSDTAGRSGTPFSIFSRFIQTHTLSGSLTKLINRSTFVALVGDLSIERGDTSKPYRYIPMFAPDVAPSIPAGASIDLVNQARLSERPLEQLPTARNRFSVTVRFAHRFDGATLRLSERVYLDSWGLKATTTDGRIIFDAGRRFSFWPTARFHLQTPVDFWSRAYQVTLTPDGRVDTLPALRTGDRELGPVQTVSGGAGVRWAFGSDEHPDGWSASLYALGMRTSYSDDLYLINRNGLFGALTIEAIFE